MSLEPLVSVIITNYNYEIYLDEAIRSALNQTYSRIEVIVVDDGSTDRSPEIIKEFGSKIHPVLKNNDGQITSYNAGFQASTGDVICFLDADDRYKPEKIKTLVDTVSTIEETDKEWFLAHFLELIDSTGTPLNLRKPDRLRGFNRELLPESTGLVRMSSPAQARTFAKHYGYIPFLCGTTTSSALSRKLAVRIFPLMKPNFSRQKDQAADDYVVSAAMLMGPIYFLPMELAQYRVHQRNARYGKEGKPRSDEYLSTRDAFLNDKLKSLGLPPWFSFFESRAAQTYFAAHRLYRPMLGLAFKVVARHVSFRSLVFAALTPFKVLRSMLRPRS